MRQWLIQYHRRVQYCFFCVFFFLVVIGQRERNHLCIKTFASLSDRALSSRMRCPQREEGVGRGGSRNTSLHRVDSVSHSYQSYKPPTTTLSVVVLSNAALSSLSINMSIVITVSTVLLILFFRCCIVMS